MAISGIFYGATGNAWIKPKITWTAQADTEGNFSDVTATLSYTRTNTGYTTSGHWAGTLSINGDTKYASGVYVQIVNGADTVTVSHTVRVQHDDNGSKKVSISATGGISETTLTYTAISGEVKLEDIPRAATIVATDADIGSVSMVSIDRKSQLYTHTAAYQFGTLRGYLSANGLSQSPVQLTQTSLAFALPESFYYEIPDSSSGVCTLTCTTYRNGTVVGAPQQTTFTARANSGKCGPVLSATAVDTNATTLALTGDETKFVRYASRVLCSLSCQGRYGASITEKKIAGTAVTEDSLLLENVRSGAIPVTVRDSRGFVTEKTLTATLIPYFYPTGKMTAVRTDATSGKVQLSAQGNWFSGSFGVKNNGLQARYRVETGSWQSLSVVTDGDSYSVSAQLTGLTYTEGYTVTLEITDLLHTLTLSARVNPGIPVFDWGKDDFKFNVPVQVSKVTGLSAPTAAADAANKAYVDAFGFRVYRSLKELGLTDYNAKIADVFAALPSGSKFIGNSSPNSSKVRYITDAPINYCQIELTRYGTYGSAQATQINSKTAKYYHGNWYGGSNPAAANGFIWHESLTDVSGISMKLLWTNASPTSVFTAQTISLDLGEYDEVKVYFNIHGNYLRLFPFTLPVGSSGHVTNDQGTSPESVSEYCQFIERDMTVSTTGVTFGTGSARGAGTGAIATDNWVIIPTRIYGIKGVG